MDEIYGIPYISLKALGIIHLVRTQNFPKN